MYFVYELRAKDLYLDSLKKPHVMKVILQVIKRLEEERQLFIRIMKDIER